jgi:hypothetical protein
MDELLLLRLGLLALLLLFVLVVALTMRGSLNVGMPTRVAASARRAAVQVLAPAESGIPPGTVYELAGVMTIGRDPANSIVIVDPSVSGRHAELRRIAGAWNLVDLGSTNGTLVEDHPVDGRGTPLRPGARITVGAVVLRFQA